jgi:prevent-host-death family protein
MEAAGRGVLFWFTVSGIRGWSGSGICLGRDAPHYDSCYSGGMSTPVDASRHISTMDLRAKLGDVLDRVRLRFDTFVIERKGEEVAAIVPVERMRRLEEFARRRADELEAFQRETAARIGPEGIERRLRASLEEVRAERAAKGKRR